jgi:hypothetical protein
LKEAALLADHKGNMVSRDPDDEPVLDSPATYKAQVAASPQLMASILEQLQQGVGAQQAAAAARQAAKLAKKGGGDVAALAEQLQAAQLGGGSSSSVSGAGGAAGGAAAVSSTPLQGALLVDAAASSSTSSAAGGVPPVTPGDITVAANALLVACKAAGALRGVPQLLERSYQAIVAHKWASPAHSIHMSRSQRCSHDLSAAIHEVAEWAVLLHPLLVQLLPAEQGQVLVGLRSSLGGGSSSSSSGGGGGRAAQQKASRSSQKLSGEEVDAVLGALQHVVIPGQPGCSNPRCCCLEGVSEADVKTQVCAGCRGARYCSAACQKAHWRAGHKEVCKAVQAAAAKAATAGVDGVA